MFFDCDPDCGCRCGIAADDGTGDFSAWTVTGSPSKSGGVIHVTAGDRLVQTRTPLTNLQPVIATFTFYSAGAVDQRIELASADADNHLFVQLWSDGSSATVRLGRITLTRLEWLTDALVLDDPDFSGRPTIRICWTPATQIAATSGDQGSYAVQALGVDWTDPGDAEGPPDANGANYFLVASPGETTPLLLLMGLDLPVGATVTGMEASIDASTDSDGTTLITFQAFVDGSAVGDNQAAGEVVNIGDFASISGGGVSDDWGASLDWIDVRTLGLSVAFDCSPLVPGGGVVTNVDYGAFRVWYDVPARTSGTFRASVEGSMRKQCVTALTETTSAGRSLAFATQSGTAELDDIAYSHQASAGRPTCPACDCDVDTTPCGGCDGGAPLRMQLDLTGVVSSDTCTDCEDQVNGTYVLDFTAGLAGDGVCAYYLDVGTGGCAIREIFLFITAGEIAITIKLVPAVGEPSSEAKFDSLVGDVPVCGEFEAETIPLAYGPSPFYCDFSGATLALTAL